jgi:hypothetical protein
VRHYVKAWESNDPDDIATLFSEDARYYDEPHSEPWVGPHSIVKEWLERKDAPGDWTFEYKVLAANDEVGLIRGTTRYKTSGRFYINLWEIYLDDRDKASRFVEWFDEVPQPG